MKTFIAWVKRQKFTIKSLIALAGLIVSAISAAETQHLFPTAFNVVLASISGVALIFERVAESYEDRTQTLERTWRSAEVAQQSMSSLSAVAPSANVLYAMWQDALAAEQEATTGHHVAPVAPPDVT